MSVSVTSMRIMPGGDEQRKNCILKLAVVRILFPKPHMLLLSFIININYPVGEERDNIHHQASGFGNTLLGTQHVNGSCALHSLLVSGSIASRERNPFAILFDVYT